MTNKETNNYSDNCSSKFTFGGLATVGGRNHDGVGVDMGDTEVAAEMDEVEWAEFAGDVNDAHVARRASEDGDTVDIRTDEVEPKISD